MGTILTLVILVQQCVYLGFVLWLAGMAEKRRVAGLPDHGVRGLCLGLYIVDLLLMLFMGVGYQLLALVGSLAASGLPSEATGMLNGVGLGLWLPMLAGLILLLPFVRKAVAHIIPIDPNNTLHSIALSMTMLVLANMTTLLGLGLGNLASTLEQTNASPAVGMTILTTWVQELLMAWLGLMGVGWLSRRGFRAALKRLDIVRPTWRQVAIGLGAGVGLALAVSLILLGLRHIGIDVSSDIQKISEKLVGGMARSPWGVLTIGLAAALGEETVFRGALQPRFGIVASALIFAIMHAQYGLTLSTFTVFAIGLVLGYVRQRTNTSTSMVVHAVYNIVVSVLPF
jgi:uncharacterized protein